MLGIGALGQLPLGGFPPALLFVDPEYVLGYFSVPKRIGGYEAAPARLLAPNAPDRNPG